jgi:hypothetical protein
MEQELNDLATTFVWNDAANSSAAATVVTRLKQPLLGQILLHLFL